MKVFEFIKQIEEEGAHNFKINLSKMFILNKDQELTAILDIPIIACAFDQKAKEVRFIISEENVDVLNTPVENIINNTLSQNKSKIH